MRELFEELCETIFEANRVAHLVRMASKAGALESATEELQALLDAVARARAIILQERDGDPGAKRRGKS